MTEHNKIEQELIKYWIQVLKHNITIPAQKQADMLGIKFEDNVDFDVEEVVINLINKAINESKQVGSYNLPKNFGNIIIEREGKGENTLKNISSKRADGVTNEDIIKWWNLNDIDRRMKMSFHEINHIYLLKYFVAKEGLNPDQALAKTRKLLPVYGDSSDTSHFTGDDRPLPFELYNRVDAYMINRNLSELVQYKKDIENSSSFNALIRREIRSGKL